ncbi:uncharacterized protein LOC127847086 [Dreissena polymorpha]|uniref:uncharacterized protein LOC127847086 n=1 Tax=Dreissena polymorpha TaxID=45954 RepID=UPI0022652ED9|nr:uncharacterized protein LOC127847086 [Dreissena polymorpha]
MESKLRQHAKPGSGDTAEIWVSFLPQLLLEQQTILAEIQYETRLPTAITQFMAVMFTLEQRATCSFKGASTIIGTPRPGLPNTERNAILANNLKVPVPREFFGYVWDNRMSTKHRFRLAEDNAFTVRSCVRIT